MTVQAEKAARFRALHEGGCFVIPNPWDAGSARLLEREGFAALATTSAGFAFAEGRPDMAPGRDALLANARRIVEATDVPVAADLIDGFGRDPEAVAETIRAAAGVGLVGGSIEDAVGELADPILPIEEAAARVRAAAAAARSLPFDFVLTARAENFFHGRADLDDTIARLNAYAEAGADVLYAPGVVDPKDLERLIASVDKPVNVLSGIGGNDLTVDELGDLGARRISLGSMLWGLAHGAVRDAVQTLAAGGGFGAFRRAIPYSETQALFASYEAPARDAA